MEQKIKIDSNFINNTSRLKSYQRPESSLGLFKKDSPDQDIIGKLRMEYKSAREEEVIWEKKAKVCPKCGGSLGMPTWAKVLIIVLVVVFLVLVVVVFVLVVVFCLHFPNSD